MEKIEDAGFHLRWFTPGTEVEICGHATLASARSGYLKCRLLDGGRIAISGSACLVSIAELHI